MNMDDKKISIVVSVYNEEKVLNKFLEAFENMKMDIVWNYELILLMMEVMTIAYLFYMRLQKKKKI